MNLKIIAGPCSISKNNLKDIYEIADIQINNKYVIWGTRVVGLKSRTNFGHGMGIDFLRFIYQFKNFYDKNKIIKTKILPSIKISKKIIKETNLLIATEIMDPILQLSLYSGNIPKNKLLVWNPAVNQLGWPIYLMAKFVKKNSWYLGIKNPKWVGDYLKNVNNHQFKGRTSCEKTWEGLVSYANVLSRKRIFLIHRGVDVPEKGKYRNAPVHYLAMRVKKHTNCLLFFDPSHSHGPQMKEKIIPETIKAMKMKFPDGQFVYDGILIEVGNSETDKEQHLTLDEFKKLVFSLSKIRTLESRIVY
ncbi:MAG: hypothetical protein KatS3mg095_0613 [Candidatus Parcubacteria bacterium]|nr:MAG: hypothetical protein KatS3mg095_0613 [Candidatus Parcubacteria bacterium]